jgi:hypothetical protein
LKIETTVYALCVNQDEALRISQRIWGDVPRIGAVDPYKEPYHLFFLETQIIFPISRLIVRAAAGDFSVATGGVVPIIGNTSSGNSAAAAH